MSAGSKSKRIDVLFDVYWKSSIKNAKRSRRGTSDVEYKNILAASKTPNWKTFLASPANKTQLINLFTCQFKQEAFRNQLHQKEFYITNGRLCTKITQAAILGSTDRYKAPSPC